MTATTASAPGQCGDPYKFTGKERDAESGLDYFGARHYMASYGRFITPDPYLGSARRANPQTLNRYSYVLNNPLNYVDPDGLDACPNNSGNDKCTTSKTLQTVAVEDKKNQTITVSRIETVTTRNEDGEEVQVVEKTTSVKFSTAKGTEGSFLSGTESTRTLVANPNGPGLVQSGTYDVRPLGFGEARQRLGHSFDMNGIRTGYEFDRIWKALQPNRGAHFPATFAREVAKDARENPWTYAGHVAGLAGGGAALATGRTVFFAIGGLLGRAGATVDQSRNATKKQHE